jgi:hypothetical protein
MQITINFNLTSDDFADIFDTAGYAIGYWVDEAEYDAVSEIYSLSCEEGAEIHTVCKSDAERAIALITENRVEISDNIRADIMAAIKENDYGYIDGYAADAIIQVACFKEIVYG